MHHMVLMATIVKCIEMTKAPNILTSEFRSISLLVLCVCFTCSNVHSTFWMHFQLKILKTLWVAELFSLWKCKSNIGRLPLLTEDKKRGKKRYIKRSNELLHFFYGCTRGNGCHLVGVPHL